MSKSKKINEESLEEQDKEHLRWMEEQERAFIAEQYQQQRSEEEEL